MQLNLKNIQIHSPRKILVSPVKFLIVSLVVGILTEIPGLGVVSLKPWEGAQGRKNPSTIFRTTKISQKERKSLRQWNQWNVKVQDPCFDGELIIERHRSVSLSVIDPITTTVKKKDYGLNIHLFSKETTRGSDHEHWRWSSTLEGVWSIE